MHFTNNLILPLQSRYFTVFSLLLCVPSTRLFSTSDSSDDDKVSKNVSSDKSSDSKIEDDVSSPSTKNSKSDHDLSSDHKTAGESSESPDSESVFTQKEKKFAEELNALISADSIEQGPKVIPDNAVVVEAGEQRPGQNAAQQNKDRILLKDQKDQKDQEEVPQTNDVLTAERIETLFMITEAKELSILASKMFEQRVSQYSKYIYPDDQLKFLKDKLNAEFFKVIYGDVFIKLQIWKFLLNHYIHTSKSFVSSLEPLSDDYLSDMDRVLRGSSQMVKYPLWALGSMTQNMFAKFLYGCSLGAQDLILFIKPSCDKMEISLDYSSAVPGGSQPKNKISLIATQGKRTSKIFEKDVGDKVFDINLPGARFTVDETKSAFTKSTYLKAFSRLYDVSIISSDIRFAIAGQTHRTGIVLKGDSKENIYDGFSTAAVFDTGVKVYIQDKYILDMLISLLHVDVFDFLTRKDGGDRDEKSRSAFANYLSTVLMKYFRDQLIITQGVTVTSMDIKILISAKDSSTEQPFLDKYFHNFLNKGSFMPISPLHFLWHFESTPWACKERFKELVVLTSFGCPGVNSFSFSMMPSIDKSSRVNFMTYCENQDWLKTSYYTPPRALPWQKSLQDEITLDDFMSTLYCRTMLTGDFPKDYPVITRGGWVGVHISSMIVNAPSLHPICKLRLPHVNETMFKVIDLYSLIDVDIPGEIRRQTRVSQEMPSIFSCIVP